MRRELVLFVAIVQSLLFFGHWLLYISAVTLLELTDPSAHLGLQIALTLLSITFVTASIYSFRSDSRLSRLYYTAAATWLGTLHCLLLASVVGWIVLLASEALALAMPVRSIGVAALTAGLAVAAFALGRTRTPRVTRISVTLPNVSSAWRGKKLVWISDLHLGHIRRARFARRIVDHILKLKPALVFVGGDLFDGGRTNARELVQPLSDLAAHGEVFFVTGNHELFTGRTTFVDIVREIGLTVLDDAKVDREGLQIAGLDWQTSRNPARTEAALTGMALDRSRPAILLVHAPDRYAFAEQAGVTLQLSGHTHRGQLWPFSMITKRVYRGYDYGLKQYRAMTVYTSSGAGTWGPPMRLGSPSEIVEITLQ